MSNPAVFASLTTEVANIDSCAQLQDCINRAAAQFTAQYVGINSQITALAPIAALLTAPADPTAAVTWIANFITGVLTPMYAPYAKYTAQLTELTAAYAAFGTAAGNAATRIGSCTVTIPPL